MNSERGWGWLTAELLEERKEEILGWRQFPLSSKPWNRKRENNFFFLFLFLSSAVNISKLTICPLKRHRLWYYAYSWNASRCDWKVGQTKRSVVLSQMTSGIPKEGKIYLLPLQQHTWRLCNENTHHPCMWGEYRIMQGWILSSL